MKQAEDIMGTWYLYSVSTNREAPILSSPITELTIKINVKGNLEATFDRKDGKHPVELKKDRQHHYFLGKKGGKYRVQVTTRYGKRPMLFGYATGPEDAAGRSQKDSFIGFRQELTFSPSLKYPISLPMHRLTFYHRSDHPHEDNRHIAICRESATLTLSEGKQVHFEIKRDEELKPGRMLTMVATEPGPNGKEELWGWLLAVENEDSLVFNCIFHHNYYYSYDGELSPAGPPGDLRCTDHSSGGNG
jgi:hypothetical protein